MNEVGKENHIQLISDCFAEENINWFLILCGAEKNYWDVEKDKTWGNIVTTVLFVYFDFAEVRV